MNVNEKMISVVEQTNRGERQYDLASRLLEDRIIFLSGEVNTDLANYIIAQLIYLEARDPHKDIALYINSPGGSVTDGMAIFDTMNYIKCDVSTISIGLSASMGAFLLAAGAKGKRYALPNSEIMIHQPLGGAQGQASDICPTKSQQRFIVSNCTVKQKISAWCAAGITSPKLLSCAGISCMMAQRNRLSQNPIVLTASIPMRTQSRN